MRTLWLTVFSKAPFGEAVHGFFESEAGAREYGGDFLIPVEENDGIYSQADTVPHEYSITLFISVYANPVRWNRPYVIGFHASAREARECPSASKSDDLPIAIVPIKIDYRKIQLDAGLHRQMPSAGRLLQEASDMLRQRAEAGDSDPTGTQLVERAAEIMRAWTGQEMYEADIWRVLIAVKMARIMQGPFCADDYVELAGYAALLGECEGVLAEESGAD